MFVSGKPTLQESEQISLCSSYYTMCEVAVSETFYARKYALGMQRQLQAKSVWDTEWRAEAARRFRELT